MPGMDLGIDLGTSQVVISAAGRGVVLKEPAVIAVDSQDGHMIACGQEAYDMLGRTPESITAVRPVVKGVISDYDYAQLMLRVFVRKVCAYKLLKPRAAVCLPASVTEVEQRSAVEAVLSAGVRRVVVIEKAVAAAIGCGLDIAAPHGNMVVELGGGTTDVVVMSLKGISSVESVRVGGDDMDEAIIRYLRSRYGLVTGRLTAEQLKKTIGRAVAGDPVTARARGRDALSGLPRAQEVTSDDIREAISEQLDEIVRTVQRVLENTPPELVGDVLTEGIVLSGGLAQLQGMAQLLQESTGVACRLAENPEDCVALGTVKAIQYVNRMTSGVYDIGQFTNTLSDAYEP